MKLSSFKVAGSLALLCGTLLTVSAPAQAVAIAGGSTFSTAGNVFVPTPSGDLLFSNVTAFSTTSFAPIGFYGLTFVAAGTGDFAALAGTNVNILSLANPTPGPVPFLVFNNFSTFSNIVFTTNPGGIFISPISPLGTVSATFAGTLSYLDGGVAVSQALNGVVTTQFAGGNQVTSYSSTFVISAIPEPSPLVGVLALGLLGGIVVAYNRRRQAVSS